MTEITASLNSSFTSGTTELTTTASICEGVMLRGVSPPMISLRKKYSVPFFCVLNRQVLSMLPSAFAIAITVVELPISTNRRMC